MDGTPAGLDVERARALSGRAEDVDWAEEFEVMRRYARNRGWMREAALARAHLTRTDPSTRDAPTRDGRS